MERCGPEPKRRKVNQNGRRRPPAVSLAPLPVLWDTGADGPANRERLRIEPATDIDPRTGRDVPNPNGIHRARRRPMVEVIARRAQLTPDMLIAASRLHAAAHGRAEGDPLAALRIDRMRDSCGIAAGIDARRLFRRLWAAVPGDCRPVLQRIVIDDEAMQAGWGSVRRESHYERLRRGLLAVVVAGV